MRHGSPGTAVGREFEGAWWRFPVMRDALVCGGIGAVTWSTSHLAGIRWVEPVGYALAMALGAKHFVRHGLAQLRHRQVGIELLMGAAAVGAASLGLWDEAAVLVFLYAAAEALEEYAYARTRSAIRALLDLAPKEAVVVAAGRETTVPATDLRPGDVFVVRPGAAIPTDGIVREGTSAVDESPVTGESMPVEKGPGDVVFAGSVNRHGALTVEATASFEDNTLSKIIHLVEEAQEQKGRLQRVIERFGRRYSPAVLVAALGLAVVPPLVGYPWDPWARRAVVLVVAAAPCALVMSTPVVMAAAIGIAGRYGVLIKGGVHLEHLGRVRVVAFDKTGTLTEGRPEVTDVLPLAGVTADALLWTAATVECRSEHPIGQAIVRRARAGGIVPGEAAGFEALAGMGARARLDAGSALVGSPRLFQAEGVTLEPVRQRLDDLEAQGKTVVLVARDHVLLGILGLQDRLRPGVEDVVATLRRAGIRTVMLTGDHARTAAAIAGTLGIDEVYAELVPEDKVRHVRRLAARYGAVAMVGDGINDAPALTAATVGVAMGVAGTDVAIEAADVALMADDLGRLVYALRLGRAARAISGQNIVFSLLVLLLLVPGALAGVLTVVAAVVVHELSELLAVANGLRVARCRPA